MCVGGVEIYIKGKGGTTKVKNRSFLRVFADLPFDVHLGVYILFSIVTKSSPQQVKIPTRLLRKPPLARPKKGGASQAKGRTKPRISIFRGGSAEGLRKTTSISHLMYSVASGRQTSSAPVLFSGLGAVVAASRCPKMTSS